MNVMGRTLMTRNAIHVHYRQVVAPMRNMYGSWLAVEHSRMHIVEQWPAGPRRDAVVAGIRSAIQSLVESAPREEALIFCPICARREDQRS